MEQYKILTPKIGCKILYCVLILSKIATEYNFVSTIYIVKR
jgi:hypothetical protein